MDGIAVEGNTIPPPEAPLPSPALSDSCGLDIALVMDSSGSLNGTELGQIKSAFEGFVGAFLPATPTMFSVTDFDDDGNVLQQFTNDIGLLSIAINAPTSGGSTNWADGLADAFGTFSASGTDKPNLVVFASDGNPTEPGTNAEALQTAIEAANDIKESGTRIIALGVGDGLDAGNLEDISSVDAVYTSDFANLATTLSTLASELCGGTITVTKVIDADGNLGTTGDQTPGEGWDFVIDGDTYTTDAGGQTDPVEVSAGMYSVTETVESGYSRVVASCTGASNNGGQSDKNSDGMKFLSKESVPAQAGHGEETTEHRRGDMEKINCRQEGEVENRQGQIGEIFKFFKKAGQNNQSRHLLNQKGLADCFQFFFGKNIPFFQKRQANES